MATKKATRLTVDGVYIYIVNINKKQTYTVFGETFSTMHEALLKVNPVKETQRWLKKLDELQKILGD